ncbi:MAG: hypothetical protein Q7R32_06715 [Dehalococcoidia bacterium]|nr:hypothetical protein [Dehalococcoidia bacterium]
MSGFVARVIEDWLTSSDERAYQLSFASYLAKAGHRVKYVSQHSVLEHGKDIVSISPDRNLHAYQLKAGNINLPAWREMRGEVLEAATVPVEIPGVARRCADRAFLVLTGQVSDPVRNQIALINKDHESRRYAPIETIELQELVGNFADVFESFFPATVAPLHDLVRLYLQDGRGPQDKRSLFTLLSDIVTGSSRRQPFARTLSNLTVACEFAAAPFRNSGNHISVIDTWVVAACSILIEAKRSSRHPRSWRLSLDFCKQAIAAAGDELLAEGLSRDDFSEGDPLIDAAFSIHRKLVALGYMGAVINARSIQGDEVRNDSERLLEIVLREAPFSPWGEGAWNYYLNLALALRHTPNGNHAAERIIASWVAHMCPRKPPWPKAPYWRVEDEISLSQQREQETPVERARISYTAAAAMGFLSRRMLRNTLQRLWPAVSKYDLAHMVPPEAWSELNWNMEDGTLELHLLPLTGSWSQLRSAAGAQRSGLFEDEQSWLLPFFLCTYPHRAAPTLSGELDFRTSPESFRKEWRK